DQPFDEAVLPRRAWGNRLVTDAHGPYSLRGSGTVDTVPIADQVARSLSLFVSWTRPRTFRRSTNS
ncbi:MAG TPA: hypothetical protein VK395_02220, partial [Gemmataceae bacterium]|nr:hypothetical protein [Gemmataceae bacterium]